MPTEPEQTTAHVEVILPDHHEEKSNMVEGVPDWVWMFLVIPLILGIWKFMVGKLISDTKAWAKKLREDIDKLQEDTVEQELEIQKRLTLPEVRDEIDRASGKRL